MRQGKKVVCAKQKDELKGLRRTYSAVEDASLGLIDGVKCTLWIDALIVGARIGKVDRASNVGSSAGTKSRPNRLDILTVGRGILFQPAGHDQSGSECPSGQRYGGTRSGDNKVAEVV